MFRPLWNAGFLYMTNMKFLHSKRGNITFFLLQKNTAGLPVSEKPGRWDPLGMQESDRFSFTRKNALFMQKKSHIPNEA